MARKRSAKPPQEARRRARRKTADAGVTRRPTRPRARGGVLRAGSYHRVSTRDQRPELARRELDEAARMRGCRMVARIEETGAGWRSDRPGLLRLLALAEAGKLDVVFCWKLDRLGRSVADCLSVIQRFEAAGVAVVFTSQGITVDPSAPDPLSRYTLTILAAAAEFELGLISERTLLAARHARRRGLPWGRRRTVSAEVAALARELRKGAPPPSWAAIAKQLSPGAGVTLSAASVRRAALDVRKGRGGKKPAPPSKTEGFAAAA